MAHGRFHKITKKEFFLAILIPFVLLCTCLKADFGNFDTANELLEVKQAYGKFEFSGHPFEFSRTRSLFLSTLSISQEHNFDLDADLEIFARGDTGISGDKVYSWAPPGTAIIGAIFFSIFKLVHLGQLGTYLSVVVVSTILHFLIYRLMFLFLTPSKKTALLGAYIYTFATIALTYSITYFQHQYTVLALCLMLLGIWQTKTEKKVSTIWSLLIPFIFGISVFFDYPNLILLSPLLFAWILLGYEMNKKYLRIILIRTALVVSLCLSVLFLFNQENFGRPFQMSNTLPIMTSTPPHDLELIRERKNNILNIFNIENVKEGISMYTINPRRGLFFFCPVLLMGILGLRQLWNIKKKFVILCFAVIFVNLLLYASFSAPSGGWCFGPRYLLPTTFILSICSALWFEHASIRLRFAALPLLLLSILNNLSGALSTLTIPEYMETFSYGIKNFDFILLNITGSFVYNEYFRPIPLVYYACLLAAVISSIFLYLIFQNKPK